MNEEQDWIDLAKQVATKAHQGQKRKGSGDPYIVHPTRVASKVPDRLKPIAWGHDLVEDTNLTLEDLKNIGFPQYIIDAIDVLTHKNNEPNITYWKRILTNPDAITVKLRDIEDNLNDCPSEHSKEKYTKALDLFKKAGDSLDIL